MASLTAALLSSAASSAQPEFGFVDERRASRATRPRVVGGVGTHSPFGRAGPIIGAVVILGLVLWSCYCCESCPMYDHWNPRAKEKRTQNLQQPIIGGTYQQPTQVGTVVP